MSFEKLTDWRSYDERIIIRESVENPDDIICLVRTWGHGEDTRYRPAFFEPTQEYHDWKDGEIRNPEEGARYWPTQQAAKDAADAAYLAWLAGQTGPLSEQPEPPADQALSHTQLKWSRDGETEQASVTLMITIDALSFPVLRVWPDPAYPKCAGWRPIGGWRGADIAPADGGVRFGQVADVLLEVQTWCTTHIPSLTFPTTPVPGFPGVEE